MTIRFYSERGPHGDFSNFSAHPFYLDGERWRTSEHYFQAAKFVGTPHADEVRQCKTPKEAADMGRERKRPLRRDWESVKDDVMRRALEAKFRAHDDLRLALLATGTEELIEAAPGDFYWGEGRDGTGKNMLGKLRERLRKEAP